MNSTCETAKYNSMAIWVLIFSSMLTTCWIFASARDADKRLRALESGVREANAEAGVCP